MVTLQADGSCRVVDNGRGIPVDADFVFDVRMLPNPHYEPQLKALTGRDQPVMDYLLASPDRGQYGLALLAHVITERRREPRELRSHPPQPVTAPQIVRTASIEVAPASGLSLEIVGPGAASLEGDPDNLVLKAARLLAAHLADREFLLTHGYSGALVPCPVPVLPSTVVAVEIKVRRPLSSAGAR